MYCELFGSRQGITQPVGLSGLLSTHLSYFEQAPQGHKTGAAARNTAKVYTHWPRGDGSFCHFKYSLEFHTLCLCHLFLVIDLLGVYLIAVILFCKTGYP